MKKVLIIIPDYNKEKFIAKGFASAFKEFSFFVFQVKTCDLDINIINKHAPDLVFIFWSGITNKDKIKNLIDNFSFKAKFIHYSEYKDDIPKKFQNANSHYNFSLDLKKNKYIQAVSKSDYSVPFRNYKYNITFAGNPAYQNREYILSQLIKNFGKINVFCRSFDFYKSIDNIIEQKFLDDYELELYKQSYKGYVNSTKELADIYSLSKINIDIENAKHKDINYRLLEITASGAFVIAPYNKFLIKQYDNGKDIETYNDIYELIDKTDFYLKHTEIARMIAINGKKNTIGKFSYNDKLKEILKVVYGKNFSS